ncbi:protein-lysine N-methyltransferase EEF2KMT isoform X2 [Ambystoma mexicanum]|uniref:protein-lysine N-methyltransferase EEF2KMT isoform X2 n=1 Tax=Ambystoma mexicanum TaxID=8296 RepID=UPI0037E900C2
MVTSRYRAAFRMDSQSQNLVSTFQSLFLAGQHLNFFPWMELEEQWKKSLDHLLLLDILKRTVRHPLCTKYPPSVKYMRIFLLELIKKHESTATEPLDELYEALGKVLNMEESTQWHKSYFLPSGESITLLESLAIISMGTTGLVTWKAALYLSEWAMEVSDLFNNRTVLELGSGIGLTGLVICKTAHPKKYIFSDCHEEVLQQLTRNIKLNGFHVDNRSNPQSIENLTMPEGDLPDERSSEIIIKEFDWEKVTEEQLSELKIDIAIAAGEEQKNSRE